ncbi:hypothetical protein [Methanobrevibacter arboriphilus]|uniref:hypothetical protein n=1 Tax=Methanobrevibacter arboriphilus TaxID=39441 RepID=UPI0006CF2DC6|nr:hypothetical protein [Methanobrevibacter arboriphilus]
MDPKTLFITIKIVKGNLAIKVNGNKNKILSNNIKKPKNYGINLKGNSNTIQSNKITGNSIQKRLWSIHL